MPYFTKVSLELLVYPPVHKDIPTDLYTTGVPLIAERIFSLLNPAYLCSCLQVCTTWNYQVSTAPRFVDKVSAYCRKCKENAENRHASKKQKEVIVFPIQRQPLAAISFKYVKPVWHESGCSGRASPSKRPRQSDSEDICGTKKSKKRLRRL